MKVPFLRDKVSSRRNGTFNQNFLLHRDSFTTIHKKKHLLHDLTPNAFTKKCLKQSKVKSFKSRHLRRQLVSEHQS